MSSVTHRWYSMFAHKCGIPMDHNHLAFFEAWQRAEGGSARHNPWNSTEPWPRATDYNSVHVKNYYNREDGVDATVKIIHQENFAKLLHGLQHLHDPYKMADLLAQVPWGTSAETVKEVLRGMGIPE